VVNLALTYRFGKNFKENGRRKGNGASEEQQRVGVQ
jgi:hypothetical protein